MNRTEKFLHLRTRCYSTWARYIFRPHLTLHGDVTFDWGATIRPLGPKQSLHVTFDGANRVGTNTIIQGTGSIRFGRGAYVSSGSVIGCNSEVSIGRNTMIASGVSIRDANHRITTDGDMKHAGLDLAPVDIGDNVWIGHGAQVLPGTTIGDGAVVAAGAIVTADVAPRTIVAGVPARHRRTIGAADPTKVESPGAMTPDGAPPETRSKQ